MQRRLFLYGVAVAFSMAFGFGAQAAVCASTFGAGSSYGGGLYSVSGTLSGVRVDRAFTITPTVDCRLGTIEVAFQLGGGTNGLRITVVVDNAGIPGSTVVESTTVIDQMTSDPAGAIVTGVFGGANVLSSGTPYWIVVEAEPTSGDTLAVWRANPLALVGARATRIDGAGWTATQGALAAYRVTEPVQVPAMSDWGRGALGAVLLLLAGLSIRRRARSIGWPGGPTSRSTTSGSRT